MFFTTPDHPSASTLRDGPDANLASAIDSAKYSVDMAIYALDLWSIRDALLSAHRRGIEVRLVVEQDRRDEPEIGMLVEAGVPVHSDQLDSLMHHKFTVIDGYEVWTGSMNYTVNGAYRHDNNLLRLRSSEIGASFTQEFEEMFELGRFGPLSRTDTPYTDILVDEEPVEVYFSPDDGVITRLVEMIDEAELSIDMLAFSLTSDPIGEAIRRAHARGVEIRLVIERDQAGNTGSELEALFDSGIALRLDGNPNAMHHKVIIIDGDIVQTGSYNFSRSAEEYNDENILIVHSPQLAGEYLVEFNRVFDRADAISTGEDR